MPHLARSYVLLLLAAGLAFGGLALPLAARAPLATEPAVATAEADDFLQTALVAGGVSDPHLLTVHQRQFDRLADQLHRQLTPQMPPLERAGEVFRFLQREVLQGNYRKQVSEIDVALAGGDFNCVSATILFVALAERAGLEPQIYHAPGHVFCRFPGPPLLEIETTSRHGLSTTLLPRPAARQITKAQLVAKIDYNRGLLLLERAEYAPALVALRKSAQLDPLDRDARENLLAGLNNAALAECAAGRFAAAAALLDEARGIDPHYTPLRVNEVHVYQKWVLQLCEAGQFAAALDLLDRGYARRPEVPLFAQGRRAVCNLWNSSQHPADGDEAGEHLHRQ